MGYWVPEGAADWDNTLVYVVAHSSRDEAKKLGRDADRPGGSGGNQIRAGQQAGHWYGLPSLSFNKDSATVAQPTDWVFASAEIKGK